jgi:hypothetical protein
MKSHQYDLRTADVARLLGGLLVPVILVGAALRLGALTGLLPVPWPALDVDRTILTHQAATSQKPSDADILFIGDSSCLMDISGAGLNELFRGSHQVLNLGTFMYVGFDGYAAMLSRYATANPGRVRTVVAFVHPEMLRSGPPASTYLAFLSDFYAGTDLVEAATAVEQLRGLFGLAIFQDRFLSRLPLPLPKEYGRFYGFNLDLYRFMDEHAGCAVDPHQYVPGPGQGNAEYRLALTQESGWMALRAAVPSQAKLVLGLAPIPQSFAPPDYSTRWQRLLDHWAERIQPDAVLTNLPPILPDSDFANTTHLNATGAAHYTDLLAPALQPFLSP